MSHFLLRNVRNQFCVSVSDLLGHVMADHVSNSNHALQKTFGAVSVDVRLQEEAPRVSLQDARQRLDFLHSRTRHITGQPIIIAKRSLKKGGSLAVAGVIRDRTKTRHFQAYSLEVRMGPLDDPVIFMKPGIGSGKFGIKVLSADEAGLEEVDFLSLYVPEGSQAPTVLNADCLSSHVIACRLDDGARRLLAPAGLKTASKLEIHGFFATRLAAVAQSVRLVFDTGKEKRVTFPDIPGF